MGEAAQRRVERRLEELIDLLWQTDELRVAKPDVVDEARNAVYYLDELHRNAVPDTLETLVDELARLGVDLPVEARPLRFGSWIGGDRDGNPNVPADDDARRARAPARARAARRAGRDRRAARRPVLVGADHGRDRAARGVAGGRPRAPARARPALPAPQRRGALPPEAHAACARSCSTRGRASTGRRRHEPGRDYVGTAELLADLVLVRDSLLLHRGELIARGRLEQAIRTAGGLRAAPGDARRARARRRPPRRRRAALRPRRRRRPPVSRPHARRAPRAAGRRAALAPPARPHPAAARRARHAHLDDVRRHPPRTGPLRPRRDRVLHRLDDPRRRRRARRRRAGPRGAAWSTSTPASRGSASCRCSRRRPSCAGPATCSTSCCPSPPTGGCCRCAATCRR